MAADRIRQILSEEVVKPADQCIRGEWCPPWIHIPPIALPAEVLDHFSKLKRKLNGCAVAANILRRVELPGASNVYRNTGPVSPVANILCAKLKEAADSGCGTRSRRYAADQVCWKAVVVQESLNHGLVWPLHSTSENLPRKTNVFDSLRCPPVVRYKFAGYKTCVSLA